MNIDKFALLSGLYEKTEIEKVELLAFFHNQLSGIEDFTIPDICAWLETLSLAKPNTSRLRKKLLAEKKFVKGRSQDSFRLHKKYQILLENKFPQTNQDNENIETIDSILPKPLYENTRGYIDSLSKQINSSYENCIYDGCAVLMRRLLEVLLILSHEANYIEDQIKDPQGDYQSLVSIINNSISSKTLKLSRNTRECLDSFRKIGNLSAHKIYYNAKKKDIRDIATDYRATIEELLYKSNILK